MSRSILENYPIEVPLRKQKIKRGFSSHYIYIPVITGLSLIFLSIFMFYTLCLSLMINYYTLTLLTLGILLPLLYVFIKVNIHKLHIIIKERYIRNEIPLFLILIEFLSNSGLTILDAIKRIISLKFFSKIGRAIINIKNIDNTHKEDIKYIFGKDSSPLLKNIIIDIVKCRDSVRLWLKRVLNEVKTDFKNYARILSILHNSLLAIVVLLIVIPSLICLSYFIDIEINLNYIFSLNNINNFFTSYALFCILLLLGIFIIYIPIILAFKPNFKKTRLFSFSKHNTNLEDAVINMISCIASYVNEGRNLEEAVNTLRVRRFNRGIETLIEKLYRSVKDHNFKSVKGDEDFISTIVLTLRCIHEASTYAFNLLLSRIRFLLGTLNEYINKVGYRLLYQLIIIIAVPLPLIISSSLFLLYLSLPVISLLKEIGFGISLNYTNYYSHINSSLPYEIDISNIYVFYFKLLGSTLPISSLVSLFIIVTFSILLYIEDLRGNIRKLIISLLVLLISWLLLNIMINNFLMIDFSH